MIGTKSIGDIVRKVGIKKGYRILDNKRIPLSSNPKISYQPDFLLIGEKGYVVVEIELTTDMRKMIVGDIVRAGLIGATYFVGVVCNNSSKKAVKTYGEFLTKRIKEIGAMKVFSILPEGKDHLEKELEQII